MTIIEQQGADSLPLAEGLEEVTTPVLPPIPAHERMRHLDESVYDLSAESHLMKLAKVLLGDAGAGRLAKGTALSKFMATVYGSHFYDLDRFFGALFGARRRVSEVIGDSDPFWQAHTPEEWEEILAKDDSFRSRMEQLIKAIAWGATPAGMELIAEALLNVDCDVYESFIKVDRTIRNYGELEALGTYGDVQAMGTYGDLEADSVIPVNDINRSIFVVVPKRPITEEERYDVLRVLNVLKPAMMLVRIEPGVATYAPVPIRDVQADSEYWQIVAKTPGGDTVTEIDAKTGKRSNRIIEGKAKPAWSAYQGEAWTHLHDIAGISSYATNASDEVVQWLVHGWVQLDRNPAHRDLFPDHQGTTGTEPYQILFTPDLAVADVGRVMTGRMASDGILVTNPYQQAKRGGETILPVYFDQVYGEVAEQFTIDPAQPQTLEGLYNDGYALYTSGRWVFWGVFRTHNRFWATDYHPRHSTRKEVVEMHLRTPRLVNYVSLELAKYPHQASFQAWDDYTGDWVTLREWKIRESMPQRIVERPNYVDTHPQHALDGHWEAVGGRTDPILTDKVRIVLQRHQAEDTGRLEGPVDAGGKPVDYSLAVKNWDVGYRITSREDIPAPREMMGSSFAVATTVDAKKNPVVLEVSEKRARAILDGTANTWKCEPQPTNRAVVNFYMDLRDADGEAQVVDSLYLDPARSGPHLNVYWADVDETGPFSSLDDPLPVRTIGAVTERNGSIHMPDGQASAIVLDTADLGWTPESSWTIGLQFRPDKPSTQTTRSLLSWLGGSLALIQTGSPAIVGTLWDSTGGGWASFNLTIAEANVAANEQVTVLYSYDMTTHEIVLEVAHGDHYGRSTTTHPGAFLAPPSFINLGGDGATPESGISLDAFFLRAGKLDDDARYVADHFESYTTKATPGSHHPDFTDNMLARFDQAPAEGEWLGFRGGSVPSYSTLTWHPVERDYRLVKGHLKLPVLKTKWLKLEFTNLVPEVMESFVPIRRHVRLFPNGVGTAHPSRGAAEGVWQNQRTAMEVNKLNSFADTVMPPSPIQIDRSSSPTAAQYVKDVRQKSSMREQTWLYGWQPWQVGSRAPRFREVGVHVYDEFDIVDTSKIGYFVGLKEVLAYRTDYLRDDDTKVIRERFLDNSMLEPDTTWDLDPGVLRGNTGDVVVSKSFISKNPVRAIQFASTQSGATQILPDDDFRDERLSTTDWTSIDKWHRHGDALLSYQPLEYAIVVSRDVSAFAADGGIAVGSGVNLVDEPVHPVFALTPEESGTSVTGTEGGIESIIVSTSEGGMIHAAARVTAMTSLTNPLVLQILGHEDVVLAESEHTMAMGETGEFTLSYQLGAFDRPAFQLYDRRTMVEEPVHEVSTSDPTPTSGEVPAYAPDQFVKVRLIQRGSSADTWKVDRLSLFDDGMLWEFSNDGGMSWVPAWNIRNNPNGVLSFPKPSTSLKWRLTAYRPNRVVTALQIRPWYKGQMGTVMGLPHRGPNISSYDHEPPIHEDAEFKAWSNPVPQWWWTVGRKFPALPIPGQPLTNPYSEFFGRAGQDTVVEPADTGSAVLSANRAGITGTDGEGFPITEEHLPEASDTGSRTGSLKRTALGVTPQPDDEGHVSPLHDDGIIKPPLDGT